MEKSKLFMIIIILLLIVLLGTVVGVSFYVLNMVKAQAANVNESDDPADYNKEQITKYLTQDEITKISLGDPITTNLAKSAVVKPDGTVEYVSHLAKIGVMVGYDNTVKKVSEELAATIENNLEYARSIALAAIYRCTYEELLEPDGMDKLASDIKEDLQNAFNTTLIVDVYFNERTLQ